MKLSKLTLCLLACTFTFISAASQNALINILSQNSGTVKKGGTVFLEVIVNNTDAIYSIGAYKIRTQVNVPSSITSISDTGHVLPEGWKIISKNGSTVVLSNGTDVLEPNAGRTILIAILGGKTGGPSTLIGQLSFSNGNPPGTELGSLSGDDPSDNSSTTTIKVVK